MKLCVGAQGPLLVWPDMLQARERRTKRPERRGEWCNEVILEKELSAPREKASHHAGSDRGERDEDDRRYDDQSRADKKNRNRESNQAEQQRQQNRCERPRLVTWDAARTVVID